MSYSRQKLYAFGEPLGESVTRKEGGRIIYGGGGSGGGGAPAAPEAPPPPPNRIASAAPPPAFTTYGQGNQTGSMVQSGNSFRPSTLDYSRPIYDPNYADNITGYQQSSQFYQPIYQPQYNNYANPLTAGNVANYGTNPGPSSGYLAATAQGGQGLDSYYRGLKAFAAQQSSQPRGMDYTTFNPARKALGANQADLQQAYEYNPQQQQKREFGGFGGMGGSNWMSQMQTPSQQPERGSMPQTARPTVDGGPAPDYGAMIQRTAQNQQDYGGMGGFMPQMQTPFNPYMNQYQSPFSYQQPMQQQMQQPQQMQPNYGPSQAIVGRSSQMRGTPNVMRRAEGGIASLMDDVE